jgi:hypothetical protein
VHLAGTDALFREGFRLLDEWRRTGVDRHPVWLRVASWVWDPVPLLYQWICDVITLHFPQTGPPKCESYRGFVFLAWSLCIGVIVGFLVPRLLRGRREAI